MGRFAHLSHFWSMLLFALFVSLAAGCLTQRNAKDRVRYVAWSFGLFVAIGVAIAWLMYPISR